MSHKRDASGQLYMRNRYFDPASGRFTQEDPIGMAGGLNLYGFGGGDPVNYSDPYGLCANELKDKKGRCPGGLSEDQYNEAERAIRSLNPGARDPLMEMLEGGKIQHRRTISNRRAAGSPRGRIVVTDAFFDDNNRGYQTTGERAWVLAHEFGHQLQRQQRDLLYLPMSAGSDVGDYFDGTGSRHGYWQMDANIFACRHSSGVERGGRQGHCNYFGKQ